MQPNRWLATLNDLSADAAARELSTVCASPVWAAQVAGARPFADGSRLQQVADAVWMSLGPAHWLEALRGHPRIGEQGGASAAHSEQEQAGVAGSAASVMDALREGNRRYEERFGHVFLISAAGRSAPEILAELTRRLDNDPDAELREAAEQHRRITRLRLDRLLDESP